MSPTAGRSSRPETFVVAGTATALFLVSFGLVHRWFWAHGQLYDWPTYQLYGDAIVRHGLVPYRDFHVEYPPGALPVFVLPSFASDYPRTFEWVMCACGVMLTLVVARLRPAAAFYVGLGPVLAGSVILSRFDLWPALLATAALAALVDHRHRLGWVLLGLAVAAKLWPAVLVPPAFAWSRRHGRGTAALAGLAVLAAVVLPFAILAPHGVWESVRGQAARPLQVESLGAALLTTFGHPHVVSSHGSQNVDGHAAFAAAFAALQAAAVVALWAAFVRGAVTRERLFRYGAACAAAFVAFGKVLSPQFLLWLLPLVPLVRGRRGAAALVALSAAFVLTQLWFPRHYFAYADDFRRAGIVLARDLVLVLLVAVLALPARETIESV